jgi:hypothetical protein
LSRVNAASFVHKHLFHHSARCRSDRHHPDCILRTTSRGKSWRRGLSHRPLRDKQTSYHSCDLHLPGERSNLSLHAAPLSVSIMFNFGNPIRAARRLCSNRGKEGPCRQDAGITRGTPQHSRPKCHWEPTVARGINASSDDRPKIARGLASRYPINRSAIFYDATLCCPHRSAGTRQLGRHSFGPTWRCWWERTSSRRSCSRCAGC